MLQKSCSQTQNMHQARVMCGLGTRPSMHQGDAGSENNSSYNESRREATQTHTMYCLGGLVQHTHSWHSRAGLALHSHHHILVWYSHPGLILDSVHATFTCWFGPALPHDTHLRVGFCAHDFHQECMMTFTYTGIAHMTLACWFGDDIYVLFLYT